MDAQYAAAYPSLYRGHWWWRVREEILVAAIRRILRGVPDARILDVGCGAALFFDALEPIGHVEGVETDRSAVEQAGKWRSRITVGELDVSYRPAAPFDLVLLLDVLEHVDDPESLLRRAADVMAPSGRMLVTVPAFNWLWTSHDELNHHVRRYSVRELRRVVERAGLVVEESTYLFQSLVLPKLAARLREALTSPQPRVPVIPPPGINQAVQSWLRVERAVAGWLPFGSSLMAIVKRARAGIRD